MGVTGSRRHLLCFAHKRRGPRTDSQVDQLDGVIKAVTAGGLMSRVERLREIVGGRVIEQKCGALSLVPQFQQAAEAKILDIDALPGQLFTGG